MTFLLPPRLYKEDGEIRHVGFELEFGGVNLEESAQILLELFGGELTRRSQYVYDVQTSLGQFRIEADSNFLKNRRYQKYLDTIGVHSGTELAQDIEAAVATLAGRLVPFEVIMPPLPMNKVEPLEKIRTLLQKHEAKGTKSSFFSAFGMQFNPEVPDFSSDTLLSYIRAFFLLYDWLYEESEIPLARKLAPFIHEFPSDYVDLVLNPGYNPDLNRLITDYLSHNPTRNRPLDLLPLFAFLDKDKVFSYPVEAELVKPRPTFHYRLPNSMVDDPNWTMSSEWNRWVEVEKLAAEPKRIQEISQDYMQLHEQRRLFSRSKWAERTREWLHA
ncbi:MAG: amidoligase family protein [Bdellovibrionales bacterium]